MDIREARLIVERADAISALFAPRSAVVAWTWRSVGASFGLALVMLATVILLLTLLFMLQPGPVMTVALLALVLSVPVAATLGTVHWARRVHERERALHAARVKCPRCGRTLRNDGPSSWSTCDATERVCPTCGTSVTDDAYAAAVLLKPRDTIYRRATVSPLALSAYLIPLAILQAPLFIFLGALSPSLADPSSENVAAMERALEWLPRVILPAGAVSVAMFLTIPLLLRRHAQRTARAWFDSPRCLRCRAALGAIDRGASLARCRTCGERYSVAQILIDEADERAGVRWSMFSLQPRARPN